MRDTQAGNHGAMEIILSHLPVVNRMINRRRTADEIARRLDPNSEQWLASKVARRLSPLPSQLLADGAPKTPARPRPVNTTPQRRA